VGFFSWLNKKETLHVEEQTQKRDIDFTIFYKVTDFIYEKSGIIDLDKRALTASKLQQFALSQDIYTSAEFLSHMKSNHSFYQEVLNIATVNETFFMRELRELEWLVQYIENSPKTLKILSIPSSSGEEIYSILLLMLQIGMDLNCVDICAYDINSDAINKANEGVYNEHSLHNVAEDIKEKYFTKVDNKHYQISKNLRDSVRFSQQNIFNISQNSPKYDVILSRNMFIYFDDAKREEALNIILNLLNSDGIFIKGHADHIKKHSRLQNIAYGVYKKKD